MAERREKTALARSNLLIDELLTARGGLYVGSALDHREPDLRQVLAFVGIQDMRLIHAEGLSMGPEAMARARRRWRLSHAQPRGAMVPATFRQVAGRWTLERVAW